MWMDIFIIDLNVHVQYLFILKLNGTHYQYILHKHNKLLLNLDRKKF